MNTVLSLTQNIIWVIIIAIAVIATSLYIKFRYKIPRADQALVITGGKKGLRVLPGGGAFITPRRKHQFFPLGVMTVRSDDQETHSSTLVPVVVQWTAQLRADVETPGALEKAAQGFSSYVSEDIKDSLKQTLDGEVRAVVAKMTPEEVVRDKDGFSTQVSEGVAKRMEDLGFQLISLNIAEVTDRNRYYFNASAEDREGQRRKAEKLTAEANKEVSVAQAAADEASKAAEQQRDLAVAEQRRELHLRQAAIKAETDEATTDADYAGKLRAEDRKKDLTAREGEVEVIKEQQAQAAALARREVELTQAETKKRTAVVEAEADKAKAEINAAAKARQDEIAAEAAARVAKRQADGHAEAEVARAKGAADARREEASAEADAINRTTEAKADQVRKTGLAEAEVVRASGEAEAAAILAKGEAEAEVQRKMAEALAAHDGANLRVTLAEIDRDTTVRVFTTVGEAMARIGEHATFIDMGGSAQGGDLLSSVLGNIPELLARLNVKSEALNGAPFAATLGSVVSGITTGNPSSES